MFRPTAPLALSTRTLFVPTKPPMAVSVYQITQAQHSLRTAIKANRIFAVAALAWVSAVPLLRASDDALSLTYSSGLGSDHVDRGIERAGTSWQSSFYGSVSGWKGRVWYGRPLDADGVEEVRSSLGHGWRLGMATALELSGTHFWYVDQWMAGAPAHSFEGVVRLSSIAPGRWNPSLEVAYDIRYRSTAVEVSVEREFVTGVGVWALRAHGGQVTARDVLPDANGAALRDSYIYYGTAVGLRRRVGLHWSLLGEIGLRGSANQDSAWSELPARAARGRLALSALYQF